MNYDKKSVSIIIPAKDEGGNLVATLKKVKKYASEIIVVDGHSNDNTKQIASEYSVSYILDNGLGKGDGVRLGLRYAKKEIVVIFDADGSPNEKDIPLLINTLSRTKADLVIASRRTGGSYDLNLNIVGIVRTFGCDLMVYFINRRFKTKYSDVLYCLRVIRKSVVKNLNLTSDGFEIEQEMVIKCLRKGYKVIEVPSRENARTSGQSKLKTIMGIKMLFCLLKDIYF